MIWLWLIPVLFMAGASMEGKADIVRYLLPWLLWSVLLFLLFG